MNIPTPTWSVKIVFNGKIKYIGDFTNTRPPIQEEIKEMAIKKGYSAYTDYDLTMIDNGRKD